jgi:hypothetical protein
MYIFVQTNEQMGKDILQIDIERRISKLDKEELAELNGYLNHVEEIKSLTSSKQIAMNEIQTALKEGYSF